MSTAAVPQVSISQSPTVTVDVGDTLVLTCAATGRPPLQARWKRDGLSLGANGFEFTKVVTRSDVGEYICQVVNSEGMNQTSVDVIVRCKCIMGVWPGLVGRV